MSRSSAVEMLAFFTFGAVFAGVWVLACGDVPPFWAVVLALVVAMGVVVLARRVWALWRRGRGG